MLDFLDKPGVLIVLLLALLIFGAKRLPDSARSLGRSLRILKAETKGLRDDEPSATQVTQLPPAQPVPPVQPVTEPAQPQQAPPTQT